MFIYCDIAVLILVLTFCTEAHAGKIIGGREAAPHSRPYMALLSCYDDNGNEAFCGGILVSEDFVITAAHCKAKSYKVCLGLHTYSENSSCLPVEQEFPHNEYNDENYTNDIMLLKLSTKATFDKNVRPIVLANKGDNKFPEKCVVSGWGATSEDNKDMSLELMEANVTLTHDVFCTENAYWSIGEKGPAEGDSGGPLVCEDGKAFGVISAKRPDLKLTKYTKIPYYRDWIDEIMKHN
ncbi:granzyme E-like isoform X2 [Gambusia affinis]|uniref:granzyme E-like isoform X1 n=1 Tax=Gambusia affinis TaxID=33528 RepID=UPI001CDB7981|nr:granzyme E-like isoform X1 [Gambusia affinis]XP_043986019.1 granzyme E-like isoform X2 [Gambusia affinis]